MSLAFYLNQWLKSEEIFQEVVRGRGQMVCDQLGVSVDKASTANSTWQLILTPGPFLGFLRHLVLHPRT